MRKNIKKTGSSIDFSYAEKGFQCNRPLHIGKLFFCSTLSLRQRGIPAANGHYAVCSLKCGSVQSAPLFSTCEYVSETILFIGPSETVEIPYIIAKGSMEIASVLRFIHVFIRKSAMKVEHFIIRQCRISRL